MQPTFIGVIAVLLGMMLMSRSMTAMLLLVMCTAIFGASAAINLPALGGSSIQPSVFLLLFLALRMARSPDLMSSKMELTLKQTILFALFASYGLVSAYIYPKLFWHQIELPPTRLLTTYVFEVAPLGPSSQNITQSTYLLGTLAMLIAATFIASVERRSRMVAMAVIWLAWAHIGFGLLDLVSDAAGFDALDFLRNANYTIVDQNAGSFHRVQGTFSETSAYCAFGYMLWVFITELWLRRVEERLTGWTSLVLAMMLFISTSSSAYVGLGVYGLILVVRAVYFPTQAMQRKALTLFGIGLILASAVLAAAVLLPQFTEAFTRMLAEMTINKTQSLSGVQRGFWVQKGWEAFAFSKGLGVGVGSFRSSSLISAVAGTMGAFGLATFVVFLYRLTPFHRLVTYGLEGDKTQAVGGAAAWAAVAGLAPAMVAAAGPDPGVLFAFFAGLAIAWAPQFQPKGATLAPRTAAA